MELRQYLTDAGFVGINIELKQESKDIVKSWIPGSNAEEFVISANVTAFKS